MKPKSNIFIYLIVVGMLIASCGGAGSPSFPTAPPPTPTLDHGDIPPELVGTWAFTAFDRSWTIRLTSEGTFFLFDSDSLLDVSGSYGIFGNEAIFRDEESGVGTLCYPAEGRYSWKLTEDHLVFTVIEDKCTVGRIAQWTAGWTRK